MVMEGRTNMQSVDWTRDRLLVVYCSLRDLWKALGETLFEAFLRDPRNCSTMREGEEHRRNLGVAAARLRGFCGRQDRLLGPWV